MNPKLIAFDLDGTLTQHKSPLSDEMRSTLDALRASGRQLLMVGAGACRRIFNQMGAYPIDILGNYGLQYAEYDEAAKDLKFVFDERLPCDRESVLKRASAFREKHRKQRKKLWKSLPAKLHKKPHAKPAAPKPRKRQ